jgi:hypothetical protein
LVCIRGVYPRHTITVLSSSNSTKPKYCKKFKKLVKSQIRSNQRFKIKSKNQKYNLVIQCDETVIKATWKYPNSNNRTFSEVEIEYKQSDNPVLERKGKPLI